MTDRSPLFQPTSLGDLDLPNRVLMAPLTRNRSAADGTPQAWAETYYRQRASAGLIVSEATQISAMGKGYKDTPGIHTPAHVAAWRKITDAVHAGGGRIFCQIWHVGRVSHTSLLPGNAQPVSSTAKRANTQTFIETGFAEVSEPIALDTAGIKATIADYARAAAYAKDAGFDGVEVHSANGYLLDQFLQDGVNDRTDDYGGSAENRARLLMQVLDAVGEVWPAGRIGVRLSPLGQFNDMFESDPASTFGFVYDALSARGLGYLHVVEQFPGAPSDDAGRKLIKDLRARYRGFYIANGGYDAESALGAIASGHADAVAFGRPFIANPDLPVRFLLDAPIAEPNEATFYGGDETGYTDYPYLDRE
ncbi:MAG: alkene reductase [Pseudomonadota bacterium]